ncbi:MAG TPA: DNA-directed RNA polymerase subunit H [Candidatus Nanoarchaeia archaeon]|nr:DNA-directed RNA polymerase subunit H [Candidatus Nanoarchaeia archaeon]
MEEKKIDITKHIFVPKHYKLSDEEKNEFLESNNVSKAQLPKIDKEDPAIKHLDVKKGDVIKITRKSPTTGESLFYRIVV